MQVKREKRVKKKSLCLSRRWRMAIKVWSLVNFLIKCQRLRDFGGGSAKGTFEAMMSAVECYLPREDFLSKLICLVTDGASVNFGG